MSVTSTPAVNPAVRFEPALMRRKLSGTVFYGLCMHGGRDPAPRLGHAAGRCPGSWPAWLDWEFITGGPSRRPANAGILPALVGSLMVGIIVGVITFPVGIAAAIYLNEYASRQLAEPAAPDEHQQPRRRSIDHLRDPGAGGLRPADGARIDDPVRRAHADPPHPAGGHHRLDRGPEGGPERPARGRLCPGCDPLADGPRLGPAGGIAGDHDRDHPGHGPGHRRGGSADPHRCLRAS